MFINKIFLVIILTVSNIFGSPDYKIVELEQGDVRGFKSENGGAYLYYGIPYATAPSGHDKFKAPLPPPTWKNVLNATTKNVICPQRLNNQIPKQYIMKVDCLHISLFVPNTSNNASLLPVAMFIHGGVFQQGGGNEASQFNLVSKGIIVANVNYRVGAYGFLCLGTEFAPGNAGLKDLVAALRWIKQNILKFGGDRNNVSIYGNSSGASAVEFLILSKMAAGLFLKGISESGSAFSSWAITEDPVMLAETYANQFGLFTNRNITALESFYDQLSVEDFKTSYKFIKSDIIGFVPCKEKQIEGVEVFLSKKPQEIVQSGDYNKVHYMTGVTSMEGIYFIQFKDRFSNIMQNNFVQLLPINLKFPNAHEKNEAVDKIKRFYFPQGEIDDVGYINYWSDMTFNYATVKSARLHMHHIPVYFHVFSYHGPLRLPNFRKPGMDGPGHIAQALYVQKFSFALGYDDMKSNDFVMQDRMTTMWYNFMKYGNPIIQKDDERQIEWPTFDQDETYLDIDSELSVRRYPFKERIALWDELYQKYGIN